MSTGTGWFERKLITDDAGRSIIRHAALYQPENQWTEAFLPAIGDRITLRDGDQFVECRIVERRFVAYGRWVDFYVERVIPLQAEEGPLTQAEVGDE